MAFTDGAPPPASTLTRLKPTPGHGRQVANAFAKGFYDRDRRLLSLMRSTPPQVIVVL